MSEISAQEQNESTNEAKIRTPFAKVIARKVGDLQNAGDQRTYFDIMYFNPADMEFHIGYGSYNIDYVFSWLEKYFEISADTDIEIAPVRHGRWISTAEPFMNECEDCSICGYRTAWGHGFKYCPNCGSLMQGDE